MNKGKETRKVREMAQPRKSRQSSEKFWETELMALGKLLKEESAVTRD